MPRVGFGTAALNKRSHAELISTAIEAGFRHFDGAEAREWYDDPLLGDSVERFLSSAETQKQETSTLSREDLFLVTKILPRNYGPKATVESLEAALNNFKTTYLDLVLLHFPFCFSQICRMKEDGSGEYAVEGDWVDAYKVLVDYLEQGKLRSIGVSNFDLRLLMSLAEKGLPNPHVVQNWMDIYHQDKEVRQHCHEHHIIYTAYSLLGTQWFHRPHRLKRDNDHEFNPVLENPEVRAIAATMFDKTEEEVSTKDIVETLLRWALQNRVVVLPRSNSLDNIRANGDIIQMLKTQKVTSADKNTCVDNRDVNTDKKPLQSGFDPLFDVNLGLGPDDFELLNSLQPIG